MKTLYRFILLLFTVAVTACDMEKEVDLNLPDFKSEMVVECYLEPGKPYQMTVTESSSYFDRPEPILVPDAAVTITHNGQAHNLQYNPTFDRETGKFYTHTLDKIVTGAPGETYSLDVKDSRGRHVTGFTQFLPLVPIDTIEYRTNDQNKVRLTTRFRDRPEPGNAYRYTIHTDSLSTR
ncbi:MAG TPA: hypothetical protein VK927_05495, partial [Adhaeribacter sp.]|nr:hypothetical protein [Adhaeribacter sp.]